MHLSVQPFISQERPPASCLIQPQFSHRCCLFTPSLPPSPSLHLSLPCSALSVGTGMGGHVEQWSSSNFHNRVNGREKSSLPSVCLCVSQREKAWTGLDYAISYVPAGRGQLQQKGWVFLILSEMAFSSGTFSLSYYRHIYFLYIHPFKSYPVRTGFSKHTAKIKDIKMPYCIFASCIAL